MGLFGDLSFSNIVNPLSSQNMMGFSTNLMLKAAGLGNGGGNATTPVGGSSGSSSSTSPWTMNTTNQNGKNLQTVNFGYDSEGKPNAGPFESIRDSSGNVGSGFTLNAGSPINLNQTAYNKYMAEATGPGMTSAGTAALDAANQKNSNLLNQAARLAETNKSDIVSGMQSMGGMDMGARERMMTSANRDAMRTRLDAMNQGATDIANIKATDATNKLNMLPTAQNMSGQIGQFAQNERQYNTDINQWNLTNKLNDVNNFNNYNQNQYSNAMSAWGALKSSQAQAQAAAAQSKNSGSFLGGIFG